MPATQTLKGSKERVKAFQKMRMGYKPQVSRSWNKEKKKWETKIVGWYKPSIGGSKPAGNQTPEISRQTPAGERMGKAIRGATGLGRLTEALGEKKKKGRR